MFPSNLVQATFQQVRYNKLQSPLRLTDLLFINLCVWFLSIRPEAKWLWSLSPRWVRPRRTPPRGGLSSTGSRTTTAVTCRTLLWTWLRLQMCSSALVREPAMGWMCLELSFFQPSWVSSPYNFLLDLLMKDLWSQRLLCVFRHHVGKNGTKWQCLGQLLPESQRGCPQDRCHSNLVITVIVMPL